MADNIEDLMMKLAREGKVPPELIEQIKEAIGDPKKMEELYEIIKTFAGPELEKPLEISDYYHEGEGRKFEKKWDIEFPLQLPFDNLDRKTQFHVLFTEWQRRETEGMMALTKGELKEAENIFNECLARADQIDVGELRARSYEGLMRVAERRGINEDMEKWSMEAQKARAS